MSQAPEISIDSAEPSRNKPGRPIRVAYVVIKMEAGGLERCIAHFANHLDRDRFAPHVICLRHAGEAADWIEVDDVPVIELHKPTGNDPRIVDRLMGALREHQIDLVHSHNWGTLIESTMACRRLGLAQVHAEHGQEFAARSLKGIRRWLRGTARRWAFRRNDAWIVVAHSVRDHLQSQWRIGGDKVAYLANGVHQPMATGDGDEASRIREKYGIQPSDVVIGSTGRLVSVKDFANAIRAIDLLSNDHPNAHLMLVGSGPEQEHLETVARDSGVQDRVHFVGYQDNVGDWLRAFDLYVNSSLSEAMSMSILEAMAVGLPVIATDVGDTTRMICGELPCGATVPPGDSSALARALAAVLNDDERRREWGKNAEANYWEHYTVPAMVRRHERFYAQVMRSKSAR